MLYPSTGACWLIADDILCSLLPEDPVKRAEVRFVIEYFSSKITPLFYFVLRNMTEEGKKEYVEKITIAYKRVSV